MAKVHLQKHYFAWIRAKDELLSFCGETSIDITLISCFTSSIKENVKSGMQMDVETWKKLLGILLTSLLNVITLAAAYKEKKSFSKAYWKFIFFTITNYGVIMNSMHI